MSKRSQSIADDTLRCSQAELDTQRQTAAPKVQPGPTAAEPETPARRSDATVRHRVDRPSRLELAQAGIGSEVRYDVLSGRQTIFAADRGARPVEFVGEVKATTDVTTCPFCRGNESLTPDTLLSMDDDEAGEPWLVRVVNNKYPAVSLLDPQRHRSPDADPQAALAARQRRFAKARRTPNLFPTGPMNGGHEVIIESPGHTTSVSELNVNHLTKVYEAIASRIRVWRDVPEVEYISVFKNVGARAGASLSHAHSQLIAAAILPPRVGDLIYRAGKHYDQTGCCLQCDLMRAEREAKDRIVFTSKHLTAYCPYASSLPYLTRIVPNQHAAHFEDSSDEVLADLAQMTRRLVQCFEKLFPAVDYNHVLHTRPPGAKNQDVYHWSMEWMPRITTQAGFEHASDCYINPTFPETAAAQLRDAALRMNPLRMSQSRSGHSVS
ncbi:galactose-1-phosphate uridylyltransferase [Roseimaritima ulvae]|uniref:Galactose-1-phosphate uridylyltransferase n=1 Tax=Roseimaritima ulvae TaxID=980254 RepID=A0A5B9QMF9_9BACT|nr:HIT domain-containing protein [Roseimaritima ulvae]QEG38820.1 Galactose-1-phosphate uridylyltransferase [Roseimaritima ulvae]